MPESQLLPQRDSTFIVTSGEGRERIVDVLRQCTQLLRVVAGSYIYQVSPVAIWGAASRGATASSVLHDLQHLAEYPLPAPTVKRVVEPFARYGVLRLQEIESMPTIVSRDPSVFSAFPSEIQRRVRGGLLQLSPAEVGPFKIAAARAGWPVVDDRRSDDAGAFPLALRVGLALRPYQREAVSAVARARDGVVLLPCGAGKTVVGIAVAAAASMRTLVLTPSRTVAEQWAEHFLSMTSAQPDDIRLLDSADEPRPISIATYHLATVGSALGRLFDHPWGLVIYDEVQSLPAEVFRTSAAFSAVRRLGLTATLVREDGREREIAALVGPVAYDVPWIELERQGWIAPARCVEVRAPRAVSPVEADRFRLAVTERLLALHAHEQAIVIGTNLNLLKRVARKFQMPILTGETPAGRRAEVLSLFRAGALPRVALSRIGSVGIDVPNASVLIQVSGTYGSRQEEAQRLGRILRPSPGKVATFYSVVVDNPRDVAFAERRQRYLVDQGYRYEIVPASDLPRPGNTIT